MKQQPMQCTNLQCRSLHTPWLFLNSTQQNVDLDELSLHHLVAVCRHRTAFCDSVLWDDRKVRRLRSPV